MTELRRLRRRPPAVGWAETRRLIAADVEAYAQWYPGLPADQPRWRRFLFVLIRTETFAAALRFRLQIFFHSLPLRPVATALGGLNRVLSDVAIGHDVRIGGGLHLVHGFIVIDGMTKLGRNASLGPFVTLGLSNATGVPFGADGPTLGDDVFVGTGAKLLGPIHVGDRARIGANAVVLRDVPKDHSAVGVPARSFPRAGV